MGTWLNQSIAQAAQIKDRLSSQRANSLDLLRNQPWPTLKTEAWKYTTLRALDNLANLDASKNPENVTSVNLKPELIENFECLDIVFVNGQLQVNSIDHALLSGLRIQSLSDADQNAVAELFGKIKSPRHYFGLVNDTLAQQGILIEVAEGADIHLPIRISYLSDSPSESHVRTLVKVGRNAKVKIFEHFSGVQQSLHTNFAEFAIGDEAELVHGRFMLQGGAAVNIGGCHFELATKARLNSNVIGYGSELSRLDVDIIHAGENAEAKLQGIYLLDERELFDLHTNVEHRVPHCVTEETVRGIAGGEARAVFNGRIHIHPHAQKTLAQLNNRNLLLSDRAEINTKPELEIYADDVRCAHGATVAQMDEKTLYYLQSRGVGRQQAQVMLNFAFINQLIDEVDDAALAEWVRVQLRQRFQSMND